MCAEFITGWLETRAAGDDLLFEVISQNEGV